MKFLDQSISHFAEKIEIPSDQIKIFIGLVLGLPLGLILRSIPSARGRYCFSLVLGLSIQYFVYQDYMVNCLLMTCVSYVLPIIFGRKNGGYAVFLFCISYVSYFQVLLILYSTKSYRLDISAILMLNMTKHTAFAFDLMDGTKKTESLVSDHQRTMALKEMPNFFEYICYIWFYPTVVCGPFCEFKRFKDFMERKGDYENVPNTLPQALTFVAQALIWAVVFFGLSSYNYDPLLESDEFYNASFLRQFWITSLSAYYTRARYYIGFSLMDMGLTACGISYDPKNPKAWDSVRVIQKFLYETELLPNRQLEFWNCSVQNWLKRYVYARWLGLGFRGSAFYLTFLTSVAWHGYYPGYIIAYIFWVVESVIGRNIEAFLVVYLKKDPRQAFDYRKLNGGRGIWLALIEPIVISVQACGMMCYFIMDGHGVHRYLKAMGYFAVIIHLGLLLVSIYLASLAKKMKRRAEKKAKE